MATKVYILIDGPKDDRRIRAVFSNRQAGEAALHLGDEDAALEEFAMDAPLPSGPAGLSLWHVWEYEGYLAVRIPAFEAAEIDQVVRDEECYSVDVWAWDEHDALLVGTAKIEQFKAKQGVLG